MAAIFKKGDKKLPENYRPISLTSVPGKILERIIRNEIVNHMTENNLFTTCQHGFIGGKSGCFIICATIKNCNTNLAIYARVIGNTSN